MRFESAKPHAAPKPSKILEQKQTEATEVLVGREKTYFTLPKGA